MIGIIWLVLLGLFAAYLLFFIILRTPPRTLLVGFIAALAVFAVIGTLFLIITGRFSWIWITLSALFPWIGRAFYLRNLMHQWQENAVSRIPSDHILLETKKIRHTYQVDGILLKDIPSFPSPTKNKRLSSLTPHDIETLHLYLEEHDKKAQDLLATFCQASSSHHHKSSSQNKKNHYTSGTMDRQQALDILGLTEDNASHDMILQAHRRLIARLHPDKGGSSTLAAMINEARDLLMA